MQTLGGLRPTAGHAATRVWVCVCKFGKDALFSDDGANTFTDTAVVAVVPVGVARFEVEVAGTVRGGRILRRRPVVAVMANTAVVATPAVSSIGQENATTVGLTG